MDYKFISTETLDDGAIVRVTGREDAHNEARLCVKGRYGYDYSSHPQRLTVPLIRRDAFYPKEPLSSDVRGDGPRRGAREQLTDLADLVRVGCRDE